MGIFYGLLAALLFGINPPLINKIKTKAIQQQICLAIAFFVFGLIVFFSLFETSIRDLTGENNFAVILLGLSTGVLFCLGMFFQYLSFSFLDSSKGFASCTASTLFFNALFSIVFFNEWATTNKLLLGISSLALIIAGAFMVNYKEKDKNEGVDVKQQSKKRFFIGILIVILCGACLALSIVLPKFLLNDNVAATTAFFLEGCGNLVSTIFLALVYGLYQHGRHKKDQSYEASPLFNKRSWLGLIPGFSNSLGSFVLILSNQYIGPAIGNSLSQICVSISTLIDLVIFKGYKNRTKKEIVFMVTGSIIVALGGVGIGFTGIVE